MGANDGGTADWERASAAVSGVGVGLSGLWAWYWVTYDLSSVESAAARPEAIVGLRLLEALLMVGFSAALLVAGIRLARSEFTPQQRWWVMSWCVIGLIGMVTVIALLQAHQLAEGIGLRQQTVLEEMLLGAGGGGVAGLLIGLSTAQSMRHAERVANQRDAFAFLNKLLRHNILNGINIIHGRASLLAEDPDSDDRASLETIVERSDSIAELTQNVGDVARLLSGETALEPVDLSGILRAEIETARRSCEDVEFEADIPPAVTVEANGALAAVFDHLLTNAVEHNDRESPRVDVTVTPNAQTVRVTVADNGPGLPDDRKDAAFEPKDHGDHGIGLFLVDTLVSRYDGDVWIEDNEPSGTVFAVELPRA